MNAKRTNERQIRDLRSFEQETSPVKRVIRNTSPCEVFRMARFYRSTEILRLMWNYFYMRTVRERKERLKLTQLSL